MDPRLKALIEVRELLKSEGWAADEEEESLPPSVLEGKLALRRNPILVVICLAAIATNFILIGANHDLRAAREATLSTNSIWKVGKINFADMNDSPRNLFVTLDGEWIGGTDPDAEFLLRKAQARANLPMLEVESRGLLQLWERGNDGRPILLGMDVVNLNYSANSHFLEQIKDINNGETFVIELSVDKKKE